MASPIVNIVTVQVILVLMLLMRGYGHPVDVNGAILLDNFENDIVTHKERKIFMEIPQGFAKSFLWETGSYL